MPVIVPPTPTAEDNLRLACTVVADSVNPLPITREAWRAVAGRAGVPVLEIEVVCYRPARAPPPGRNPRARISPVGH